MKDVVKNVQNGVMVKNNKQCLFTGKIKNYFLVSFNLDMAAVWPTLAKMLSRLLVNSPSQCKPTQKRITMIKS